MEDDKPEAGGSEARGRGVATAFVVAAVGEVNLGALIAVLLGTHGLGLLLIVGGETAFGGLLGMMWVHQEKMRANVRRLGEWFMRTIRTHPKERLFFIGLSIVVNVAYIYSV